MTKVWLVRAGGADVYWLDDFKNGEYIGIGYNLRRDLTGFASHEEIERAFRDANPGMSHQPSITRIVHQLEAFLFDIEPRDHILTPTRNRSIIMHGIVDDSPAYFERSAVGGIPHRRSITWVDDSIPFTDSVLVDHGIYGFRGTVKLISDDSGEFWKTKHQM